MTASVAATHAAAIDGGSRPGHGARMRADAHLVTELRSTANGARRTRVSTLRSEAPLVLRMARSKAPEPWACVAEDVIRVALTAGAAGPVGGDELRLTVDVGAGSSLVLSEISPTLLLPGPHGERSHSKVRIDVAAGGTLVWLPEPMIAARGCDHLNEVTVNLEDGARLFIREEVLLGRYKEVGGQVEQRVRVRLGGRLLYRQDLHFGAPEGCTPAVLGDYPAVGSIFIVDPAWVNSPPAASQLRGEAAVLPLAGPAVLITALGRDNLELRDHLSAGLTALGKPWEPPARTHVH